MASARMGEIVVSGTPGEELIALGLGSCIGLALVDRTAGVAGLAHIVLPESRGDGVELGKFADSAVPELISRMRALGAVERRLEAAIAGGARMFALGGELDIGGRNETAVRHALREARISLSAAATGGNRGRTVRVNVADGTVTVKEAGGETVTLLGAGGDVKLPARAVRPLRAGLVGG
jgi:chemotaxis protein CheD